MAVDHVQLTALLQEHSQGNLVLTGKEHDSLCELVKILDPFPEVTQLTQAALFRIFWHMINTWRKLLRHHNIPQNSLGYPPFSLSLMGVRCSGIRSLLKLTDQKDSGPAKFGHMIYLMAAL